MAAGDLNGDGADDIVTAAPASGGTEIRIFGGADGVYMHHSQVPGEADGLGVVNWAGQRAIGLISEGSLWAYAPVSGTDTDLLGQLDAGQDDGTGASLGSTPAGGAAGSLGAGAQQTLETPWYQAPDHYVTVTSTVTMGLPGDPDHYKWEYHVHNDSFDGSYDPPDGVVYFNVDTPVADPTQPGGTQIITMGSDHKTWTQAIGKFFADNDSVAWWDENGESNANHILRNQDGDFWFTTLPLPVVTGQGNVWSAGVAAVAGGSALVPSKLPTVDLSVEGLPDATEDQPPGKMIHINDNFDEYQHVGGVPLGTPPLVLTSDYLPDPNTGQYQIKIGDPDLVNATLSLGPAGAVGSLTWAVSSNAKVFWEDANGNWVVVTNQANFTAPAQPIDLKIEGGGTSGVGPGTIQVGFKVGLAGPTVKDRVVDTVYTGLKVTGDFKDDLISQVGTTGAWTMKRDRDGNTWRTSGIADTNTTGYVTYTLAQDWQKRAREKLDTIFPSQKQTAITTVWDKSVFIDSFALQQADPKDLAVCLQFEAKFGAAMATHVLVEQYEKQVNNVAVYATAHGTALTAEAYVYIGGGTRTIVESPAMGAVSGTYHYRYANGGTTVDILYDWDSREQTNISNVRNP